MCKIVEVDKFDTSIITQVACQVRKRGNPGANSKIQYKDVIMAFDIETTRIEEIEHAIMYIWQLQVGLHCTVIGRTWEQFTGLLEHISANLGDNERICIWVHNLSYEFQFFRGIFDFLPEDVFAVKKRKVLKCTALGNIEFRCSYMHSNMSLAEYTKKMGAKHQKLDGAEFDYNKKRYPWTPLTTRELQYAQYDVLGLVESLTNEMAHDNDDLYTIPLTSTGYVRRDAKQAMKMVSHRLVKNMLPDMQTYTMLREAFRGGNTHANRYYAGKILRNVKSADRASSYPDEQCNRQFPMSQFYHAGALPYEDVIRLIKVRKKAVIMRVSFSNIRLACDWWGCPYIPRDKCRNLRGGVFDNGRVLSADYLEMTLTDIDFKIILDEYVFDDCATFDVAHARYGMLPKPLINVTIDYFVTKTELKDVAGQEVYYTKAKNKLNSIYGMMAQDPVKQNILFQNNDFEEECEDVQAILEKSSKRAFLCYQWGVWVTAWARYDLEQGIKLAGENFVYCDTDSVKYVGNVDFTEYNKERIAASIKSGAFAKDKKGITHYMGVFEQDGNYAQFCTLGAKKYCMIDKKDSKLKVTVAGVNKHKAVKELGKAGGIRAFKPGFVFSEAGGLEAVYNDEREYSQYTVDGKTIDVTANVVLRPSTYTLGITAEYERILELSNLALDFV